MNRPLSASVNPGSTNNPNPDLSYLLSISVGHALGKLKRRNSGSGSAAPAAHKAGPMNIFASGMISVDFVLDRLQVVKRNPAIVEVEIEDLLVREHEHEHEENGNTAYSTCAKDSHLLTTVKGLLLAGDREWKSVTFVDCISADQFELWQGLNRKIMSDFQQSASSSSFFISGQLAFSFQANVYVPEDTSLKSLYTLLRAIKLHTGVCRVVFEGALYGCNQQNLFDTLRECVKVKNTSFHDETTSIPIGSGRRDSDTAALSKSMSIKVACGWRSSPTDGWSNLLDICLRGVMELSQLPKRINDSLDVACHISMFSGSTSDGRRLRRVRSATGSLANTGTLMSAPSGREFASIEHLHHKDVQATSATAKNKNMAPMNPGDNFSAPSSSSGGKKRRRVRRSKSADMTASIVRGKLSLPSSSSVQRNDTISQQPPSEERTSTTPVHLFDTKREKARPKRRSKSVDMTAMVWEGRGSPTCVTNLPIERSPGRLSQDEPPTEQNTVPLSSIAASKNILRRSNSTTLQNEQTGTWTKLRALEKNLQEMRSLSAKAASAGGLTTLKSAPNTIRSSLEPASGQFHEGETSAVASMLATLEQSLKEIKSIKLATDAAVALSVSNGSPVGKRRKMFKSQSASTPSSSLYKMLNGVDAKEDGTSPCRMQNWSWAEAERVNNCADSKPLLGPKTRLTGSILQPAPSSTPIDRSTELAPGLALMQMDMTKKSKTKSNGPVSSRKLTRSKSASMPRNTASMQADFDCATSEMLNSKVSPFTSATSTTGTILGKTKREAVIQESPAFNWAANGSTGREKSSRLPRRTRSARLPSRGQGSNVDGPAFDWTSKSASSNTSLGSDLGEGLKKGKVLSAIKRPGTKKRHTKIRRSKSMQNPSPSVKNGEASPHFNWAAYKGSQKGAVSNEVRRQITPSDQELFNRWYKEESDAWWNDAKNNDAALSC